MREEPPQAASAHHCLWLGCLAIAAGLVAAGAWILFVAIGTDRGFELDPVAPGAPEGGPALLETGAAVGSEDPSEPSREAVSPGAEFVEDRATSADEEEDVLRGRVVDSLDRPLAGIPVALSRLPGSETWGGAPMHESAGEPIALAESDAEGRFQFEVAPGRAYDLLAPAGGEVRYGRVTLTDCRGGAEYTLRLLSAGALLGQVVDSESSTPIPGVMVDLYGRTEGSPAVHQGPRETDHEGRFRFEGLRVATYVVRLTPPAHQIHYSSIEIEAGETIERRFEVDRGFVLVGRVTDASTGLPIAGVEVGVDEELQKRTLTDTQGEYELAGLGAEKTYFEIHARAEGYGGVEAHPPQPVDGLATLDLTLSAERRAVGRVFDPEGRPLSGVEVAAVGMDYGQLQPARDWSETRSDSGGRFELGGLQRDLEHVLLLSSSEHAALIYDFPANELELDVVELGDFRLQRPARIRGLVLDGAGVGISGAWVSCKGWNADRGRLGPSRGASIDANLGSRATETDARGVFHFAGLAAGSWEVSAGIKGRRGSQSTTRHVTEGELVDDLEFVFGGGHALAGRVVDPTGAGVNRAFLTMATPGGSTPAFTTSDGGFRFEGLSEGLYTIDVRAQPSHRNDVGEERRLAGAVFPDLAAGIENLRLELPWATTIQGRVVGAKGSPLAQAMISATIEGRQVDWAVSESDGTFSLVVPEGSLVEVVVQPTVADDTAPRGRSLHPDPRLVVRRKGIAAGTGDLVIEIPSSEED